MIFSLDLEYRMRNKLRDYKRIFAYVKCIVNFRFYSNAFIQQGDTVWRLGL